MHRVFTSLLAGALFCAPCASSVADTTAMNARLELGQSKWYDPGWDFAPKVANTYELCLDANKLPGQANNSRLLHLAIPDGIAPKDGWPVMVFLQVVGYQSTRNMTCDIPEPPRPTPPKSVTCSNSLNPFGKICGSKQYRHGGNRDKARQCVQCAEQHINWKISNCSYFQVEDWCGLQSSHQKSYQPWAIPNETLTGCFYDTNGSGVYNQSSICAGEFEPHAVRLYSIM